MTKKDIMAVYNVLIFGVALICFIIPMITKQYSMILPGFILLVGGYLVKFAITTTKKDKKKTEVMVDDGYVKMVKSTYESKSKFNPTKLWNKFLVWINN
jgi:uncharacterized membrane protein